MRGNPHVRFGGRAEETDPPKGGHRASARSNHTAAALMIAQGAHLLVVKERLGHSTIAVTADRYGHLYPSLSASLTSQLDVVYRETQRPSDGL